MGGAQLVPRLEALRKDAANSSARWRFVGKPTYSCLHDTTMMHALLTLKIDELYIMGINTEQCIFMTAVDAWRNQAVANVFLIEDGVTSAHGAEDHVMGLRMLRRISNATIINSTDIALQPAETVDISAVIV